MPLHARWRHFVFGGRDLWAEIAAKAAWHDAAARARAEFDLAIVSVLLDAGAGPDWRYHDAATGLTVGRSEGLALASLRMFEAGLFSADARDPLRADAKRLAALTDNRPQARLCRHRRQSDDRPRRPRRPSRAAWPHYARQRANIRAARRRAARRPVRSSCGGHERRFGARHPPRIAAAPRRRSGRAGSRWAACRSATPGGIPPSSAATPATA